MADWQPIETAPRDGKESVLLWLADEGFMVMGRWDKRKRMWFLGSMGLWQSDTGLHNITHWMPLPSPPEKE